MNAVHVQDLRHIFRPSKKSLPERTALNGVSLSVQAGEIFGLLGPNGGGKTTLFRILSTFLVPTGGTAEILGHDVVKEAARIRQTIGVVFQHPSLDKKLTLLENFLHQGHLYGLTGPPLQERIAELSGGLNLTSRLGDFVESLSGGLQRRGEIAKGLLHKPDVLLMDEPSTGLDPGARRSMWEVLSELRQTGVTVLLTTHLMEEAEKCDRLAILHQGNVVAQGTPSELKEKIGGDVILIESTSADELVQKIKAKFNGPDSGAPVVVDGFVRIEKKEGHRFIPQLVESFPGLIQSIKVGKPTLEDVFARETGHTFWRAEENEHE